MGDDFRNNLSTRALGIMIGIRCYYSSGAENRVLTNEMACDRRPVTVVSNVGAVQ